MGKKAAVSTKPKNQKKSASSQKVVKAPARQSKPTSFNVQTHPFVKKLADNDKTVRENTLKSLTQFLQTKKEISTLELLKLWRALFFSMWMSDRPLVQQKLADDLADLLFQVQPINYSTFLDSFWSIMAREWEGLDRYRLDKFYLLLRRYLAASLRKLKQEQWDQDWVDDLVVIFRHIPLNLDDLKIPNGIRFHIFDIFLDEFERIMKEGDVAFTKGVGLAIAPNTSNVQLPEFHTADSDNEEESDSDASDSDDDDDDDEEEDEGYIPETEEQIETKKRQQATEKETEQMERAKEWVILAKRIKENNVPLKQLLGPIELIAEKSKYKHVRDAAKEVMNDPRLKIWGVVEMEEEEDSDEEFTGFD